jgi:hypothetical protein
LIPHKIKWPLILLIAIMILNSCKKSESNFNASISFLNGSVGAAPITLKLNNVEAIANDSFGVLQANKIVSSGTIKFSFFEAGFVQPISTFTTNLEANAQYTGFIFDSTKKKDLFFVKDMLPTKITEGKAAIRFFSLMPNTQNLRLVNDTGKLLLSGIKFKGYSNQFEEIDTTNLPLKILDASNATLINKAPETISQGKIMTLYLIGSINGIGAQKPRLIVQKHN